MNTVIRVMVGCLVAVLMLIAPLPGNAENPDPTPSPTPTKVPAKRPKTLSDLAAGIKLQQPEDAKSGGVVIDNLNLKAMGQGAVVSEGKALGGSPSSRVGSGDQSSGDSQTDTREMAQIRDKVRSLEQQKQALDEAADERNKVNMYTGAGPQYRPPGVADPLDTQRQKIDRELDTAKKQLKGAERKARRNRSVNPSSPPPDPGK